MLYSEATSYCDGLVLGGFDDWRLPTRIELLSIVDASIHTPALNGAAFPGANSLGHWTRSHSPGNNLEIWLVYFDKGAAGTDFALNDRHFPVRCVRSPGASSASPRYTTTADTVHDNSTQLTWQKVPSPSVKNWTNAQSYCAAPWRLPTLAELNTLVDTSRTNPAIDLNAFPNTTADYVWTSTIPYTESTGWRIRFMDAETRNDGPNSVGLVRCVQ